MIFRRSLVAVVLALIVWHPAPARTAENGAAWTLDRLLSEMAGRSIAKARFTEERHLQYLDEPIRVEGELVYRAPAYLEKRILRPQRERAVIDGGKLLIEPSDGGAPISARLSDYPVLDALITGIRTMLAGDLEGLRRTYLVDYSADGADWRIVLTPRDEEVGGIVEELRLGGHEDEISLLEIREPNGDRTIMHIVPEP